MAKNTSRSHRVSSPASTGGAGPFFEQHVDAWLLGQLLVGAIPPVLTDCRVVEVQLQTERSKWHTDDFVLVGENSGGEHRHLAGQVKRTFTVSSADEECRKTIEDAWQDFQNGDPFSAEKDGIVIVTLRGTNLLLEHFSSLLTCARASRDAADFEHRIATKGLVSSTVVRYCNEIRTIVNSFEKRTVLNSELWGFLRVLYALSLDLNTDTCQSECSLKTLLAHTTDEQDVIGAADASWNTLLREVTRGMPRAQAYRREDLPESLRNRHRAIRGGEDRILGSLREHSALIFDGIRTIIGRDVHLVRYAVVQAVLASVELAQIVVVSGPAGGGKSAVAKEVIDVFSEDHFVFGFRAEEFARPHFDETLGHAQVPANAATLAAILAGQAQKVVLIESLERLLEHSTRSAFVDFLTLIKQDKSWRVVVTCRDYSADLVRSSLLEAEGLEHLVVTVPLLDDEDLKDVADSIPSLSRPLSSEALRKLLRNPYFLDKAAQIEWPEVQQLPENERAFRILFWNDVIRASDKPSDGMPRRREDAFAEIAVRRARALSPYVPSHDLDIEAVSRLHQDSLVTYSEESDAFVAPAHDILEDWAILRWIDEQYRELNDSLLAFAQSLGTYPAIRRTYRKWLGELLDRKPEVADELFTAVISDESLPEYFRDDMIVSFLRSEGAPTLLERHSRKLFADDNRLLMRVIHLLRVGCVTAPVWSGSASVLATLFYIPDGPAWSSVLRLVADRPESFSEPEHGLLLKFIEEWARGVTWLTPYPEGFEDAARIAYHLLPAWDDYTHKELRERGLRLIAKIPNGDRGEFFRLLTGEGEGEESDRAAEDFQELLFGGMESTPACRDMPDEIIATLRDYLILSEEDLRDPWGFGGSTMLESRFGIKEVRQFDFFPASAIRGPFLPLLQFHRERALKVLVELFNHSADWYANPQFNDDRLEPAWQLTLTFSDNSSQRQWASGRLWNLYRGTSVGPYVLQTALMALEKHLLEVGRSDPNDLDPILIRVLRQSESCALTAVIASVATAFWRSSPETLLVLLRSRDCVLLDRMRLVSEAQDPAKLSMLMFGADNEIYDRERSDSSALPHRRYDLEMAILNLQLGPHVRQVQETLDEHRNSLPAVDQQDEIDHDWRMALHRMDLRQYEGVIVQHGENPDDDRVEDEKSQSAKLMLTLGESDADLQEIIEQDASRLEEVNTRIAVLMWGVSVFKNDAHSNPQEWRDRLLQAQLVRAGREDASRWEPGEGGPGFVAAVCLRDFLRELPIVEREWCLEVVCSEVEQDANEWNEFQRVQLGGMQGDRACSWVLSSLLGMKLSDVWGHRILRAIGIALTHAINEVRRYAAAGIGTHLWAIDRGLAFRCVNAIAWQADQVKEAYEAEQQYPFDKRRPLNQIESHIAQRVRERFLAEDGIPPDAFRNLDISDWIGADAIASILNILLAVPGEAEAVEAFSRLCGVLVEWWDADRGNRGRQQNRPINIEFNLTDMLAKFALAVDSATAAAILMPVVEASGRHPREVSRFIRTLIGVEDRLYSPERFWAIWQLFGNKIHDADWLDTIDEYYSPGREFVDAVFLIGDWKDNVRHWRSLEGFADRVHKLIEHLPPSRTALEAYVGFLYQIGEQSLPAAFVRIADLLTEKNRQEMLAGRNTVPMLEALLRRFVYGRPAALKRSKRIREAVLVLLDMLVEVGSSVAYRMRDDFVTPMVI